MSEFDLIHHLIILVDAKIAETERLESTSDNRSYYEGFGDGLDWCESLCAKLLTTATTTTTTTTTTMKEQNND